MNAQASSVREVVNALQSLVEGATGQPGAPSGEGPGPGRIAQPRWNGPASHPNDGRYPAASGRGSVPMHPGRQSFPMEPPSHVENAGETETAGDFRSF
jgi:hypothetical protein